PSYQPVSRTSLDRRRVSEPVLTHCLPRAVLHASLPSAVRSRLSSLGEAPAGLSISRPTPVGAQRSAEDPDAVRQAGCNGVSRDLFCGGGKAGAGHRPRGAVGLPLAAFQQDGTSVLQHSPSPASHGAIGRSAANEDERRPRVGSPRMSGRMFSNARQTRAGSTVLSGARKRQTTSAPVESDAPRSRRALRYNSIRTISLGGHHARIISIDGHRPAV